MNREQNALLELKMLRLELMERGKSVHIRYFADSWLKYRKFTLNSKGRCQI